jgi:CubicO group peptidase (beta-lactamase class C family)
MKSNMKRIPTTYHRTDGTPQWTEANNKLFQTGYFSGGGGLMATTEEYAKFGEMLLGGGKLNRKRVLSPKTIELMASVFVPDTVPGRSPGRGFGQRVSNGVSSGMALMGHTSGSTQREGRRGHDDPDR